MRVLAALDKFRGTATAAQATNAVGAACWELGHDVDECPLSDGGEGLVDVLGGANRTTTVTGPLGTPVEAAWRFDGRTAVIEMARASGMALVGGVEHNDPLAATTAGTGELIDRATGMGARNVLVGLGGSATTDGGLGAIEAMRSPARFGAVKLEVACDVRTTFIDAASVFAPQKGASPAQVAFLTSRLQQLADRYVVDYGVDVRELEGSGAAGGLAGALAAFGGTLLPGFDLVADHVDLHDRMDRADLVVTGEGFLDLQSLDGKVVGGTCALAASFATPVVVVVGGADDDARAELLDQPGDVTVVSLVESFGDERAHRETRWCIEHAVREALELNGGADRLV